MSSPSLTVPPPRDEDHEDVAWALRAASAQWRREDHADAIGWVRRAAETAAEVGDASRSQELHQLADQLAAGGGRPAFPAPPAPPAPSFPPAPAAIAPPPRQSEGPAIEFEVEVDLDDDVELIDEADGLVIEEEDGIEEIFEAEEIQPAEQNDAVAPSYPAPAPPQAPPPPSARPSASSRPTASARPTAKQSPSGLPTFAYPEDSAPEHPAPRPPDRSAPPYPPRDSGLELESYDDEGPESEDDVDYGELDFTEEAPTSRASIPGAPSVPALSVRPANERLSLDPSTPAEYAQSMRGGNLHAADDIEEELGVDLSLDVGTPSAKAAPKPADAVSRRRSDEDSAPYSPTPGRASVRPSRPPLAGEISSSGRQPYDPAPSADAPQVRPIEPPSRPNNAPPSASMAEPERHESAYPPPPNEAPQAKVARSQTGQRSRSSSVGRSASMQSGGAWSPEAYEAPGYPADLPEDDDDEIFAALDSLQAPPLQEDAPLSAPPPVAPDPPVGEAPAVSHVTEVDGIDLADVPGLQDLPEDAQAALASSARIASLGPGQEVSAFGVALVTRGAVNMMPMVADATCASARKGEVLFTKGSLPSATDLRIVAAESDSRVAIFSDADLQRATSDCPWVADELAEVADRYNAFAGAVLGPLGSSLDEMFRSMVFDKCSVKRKSAGAHVVEAGKPTDGMYILGVGKLEVLDEQGRVSAELHPGDFVFPQTVLSATPAPRTVRAAAGGALLLHADRMGAHELLATCPPFLEILAS